MSHESPFMVDREEEPEVRDVITQGGVTHDETGDGSSYLPATQVASNTTSPPGSSIVNCAA